MGYDEMASGNGSPSELRRMHQEEHEEASGSFEFLHITTSKKQR